MKLRVLPLLLAAVSAAQAQNEAIIRTETRVVLVDAVATDHKGNFVRDLAAKDFRVFEDGHEQKISALSLESEGGPKHYVVLFFDCTTLSPSRAVTLRQDAMQFIDRFSTPDRYFAVVTFNGGSRILQNFTTDAAKLKSALSLVQGAGAATLASQVTTAAVRAGRGASVSAPVIDAALDGAYRDMLRSVGYTAGSLAVVRGRKAMVVFSGGVNSGSDFAVDISAVVGTCNRANVAVYGLTGVTVTGRLHTAASPLLGFQRGAPNNLNVDASGAPLVSGIITASPSFQNALRPIAEGTGGVVFNNTSDLAGTVGKIVQEQDEYYLIGYTPAVESAEGTCHTLQVKVERSGVDVRARKGYCTSRPALLSGAPPAGSALEAKAAGASSNALNAKMQLPWLYSGPGVARVTVALDLNPASVKFQKEKGKFHAEIEIAGIASKPDGSVAARLSDTAKLDFDTQAQVDAFLRAPWHYTNSFEVVPGQYSFRLIAGAGDHPLGKIDVPLAIEAWNGKTLGVSAIALSHDAHAAADLTGELDDALLEATHPMISKGMEVVPGGSDRFQTGERGYFYFEINRPDAAGPPPFMRVAVLRRGSGEPISQSAMVSAAGFARPGKPLVPVGLAIPVTGLTPGPYILEVAVAPAADAQPVIRTVAFDLN